MVPTDIYYTAVKIMGGEGKITPDKPEKSSPPASPIVKKATQGTPIDGALDKIIGGKIPSFDIAKLGLCVVNNRAWEGGMTE